MIALLLLALAATAQTPDSELDQAVALLESLESKAMSIDYQQEPLTQVLDDLSARIGVPIRGDWTSLERLGIEPSDRLSLHFDSTSATTVLAALTLAVGDDVERPVIEAHAGQIVLTRVAAIGAMRLTAIYDVRDLLADDALVKRLKDESTPIEPPQNAPPADSNHSGSETAPQSSPDRPEVLRGARGNEPAFPNVEPVPSEVRSLSPAEKLLLLITDHVDPEAWMNFGGNRSLISETNDVLVVSATPSTHRRLRSALRSLRAANSTMITVEAAIVDLPKAAYETLSRKHSRDDASFAAAIAGSADAQMIWRGHDPVSIDGTLDIESSAAQATVRLSLKPTLERATGLLRIAVEAAMVKGDDHCRVATTVSMHSDQRGIAVELPSAASSDVIRLLVLTVKR